MRPFLADGVALALVGTAEKAGARLACMRAAHMRVTARLC